MNCALAATCTVLAASASVARPVLAQAAPAPASSAPHQAMPRSASRDSTRTSLSMMVDHHEGLIAIGDSARARATRAGTKADARKLRDEQAADRPPSDGACR